MKKFISCDWGTTNFRLCLTDRSDASMQAQFESDKGIAAIFKDWQQDAAGADRFVYYQHYLKHAIGLLEQQEEMSLTGLPLVISGMASSAIGMKELPYAVLEEGFDLAKLPVESFAEIPGFPHAIHLVSGIRTGKEVMRGEETKWVGMEIPPAPSVCCVVPGTHSKHLRLTNGHLQTFSTWLTGELFALLTRYGLLAGSVESGGFFIDHRAAFFAGVDESGNSELLCALFAVRTNELFGRFSKANNYWYLSGLLIGSELRTLEAAPWHLCCDGLFAELYQEASARLGLPAPQWHSAAAALRNGQRILLDNRVG
ncbi:MAG: 2-dehydro-3-deoxygalactonokinase [Flavihumibacter sp.]